MTTPWKWYVREPGGKGMWRAVDTEPQAIAAAAEWAEDGYEAEVGPLFDGGEVERMRAALTAILDEQDARQGYASIEAYDKARAALGAAK